MADNLRHREVKAKLVPSASQALGELAARTGLSETDVINRALQVYTRVEAEQAADRQILSHDPEGETHVLTWQ